MATAAALRLIHPPFDPYDKGARMPSFAEFDVAELGIEAINNVAISSENVRLPSTAEPGDVFMLEIAPMGGVMLISEDDTWPSLFDAPRIIVTDEMTVQLLTP